MSKQQEIKHGKELARHDPEIIWGWGTPAGQIRALRRADLIAAEAGLHSGMRIMEIGCGTGFFTKHFIRKGSHLDAIDISSDLLEKAKAKKIPRDLVHFHCISFEDWNDDEIFDVVIGSSILHHLNLEVALPKIHSLLKPGGKMVFAEPNMMNPQIFFQKNIPWLKRKLGDTPDETAYVRWALANKLRSNGFTNVHIKPFDWLHPLVPSPFINTVSNLGFILEKIPLMREFSGSLLISCIRAK